MAKYCSIISCDNNTFDRICSHIDRIGAAPAPSRNEVHCSIKSINSNKRNIERDVANADTKSPWYIQSVILDQSAVVDLILSTIYSLACMLNKFQEEKTNNGINRLGKENNKKPIADSSHRFKILSVKNYYVCKLEIGQIFGAILDFEWEIDENFALNSEWTFYCQFEEKKK